MSDFLFGSINLSKIDKSLIKKVQMKDGTTNLFINVSVSKRKAPSKFGDTHFLSIAPKDTPKDERSKFIVGDLKEWQEPTPDKPTKEQIDNAPSISKEEESDLPF